MLAEVELIFFTGASSWKGTQPGQLTSSDPRGVPYNMTSGGEVFVFLSSLRAGIKAHKTQFSRSDSGVY